MTTRKNHNGTTPFYYHSSSISGPLFSTQQCPFGWVCIVGGSSNQEKKKNGGTQHTRRHKRREAMRNRTWPNRPRRSRNENKPKEPHCTARTEPNALQVQDEPSQGQNPITHTKSKSRGKKRARAHPAPAQHSSDTWHQSSSIRQSDGGVVWEPQRSRMPCQAQQRFIDPSPTSDFGH